MGIVRGTSRNDKLTSFGDFFETDELYGLGGDDVLKGSFSADNYVYGGDGDDHIEGGSMSNYFYGGAGDDVLDRFFGVSEEEGSGLYGGGGNDHLLARGFDGGGESLLNGGAGADTMEGGEGRDIYVVNTSRDEIIETFVPEFQNEIDPRDEVRSTVTWTLATYLEDLVLIGKRDIDGTGNADANRMTGNAGDNRLNGMKGKDTIDGRSGDDVLFGGDQNDRLIGGRGLDRLYGDDGADRFIFKSLKDSGLGSRRDQIRDFSRSEGDKIDLASIDADATTRGEQSFDFMGSRGFSGEAGELRYREGRLYADIDGDRAADFEIGMTDAPRLGSGDFLL